MLKLASLDLRWIHLGHLIEERLESLGQQIQSKLASLWAVANDQCTEAFPLDLVEPTC